MQIHSDPGGNVQSKICVNFYPLTKPEQQVLSPSQMAMLKDFIVPLLQC
jgi:hypothetical protein